MVVVLLSGTGCIWSCIGILGRRCIGSLSIRQTIVLCHVRGMMPAVAELQFLEQSAQQDMYGLDWYRAAWQRVGEGSRKRENVGCADAVLCGSASFKWPLAASDVRCMCLLSCLHA